MKTSSLMKKITLLTIMTTTLALGIGFNLNFKGSEGEIPHIGVSAAQAMIPNPNGYEIPDFTEYKFIKDFYHNVSDKIPGKETLVEMWKNSDGDVIFKCKFKGETFAYSYARNDRKKGYTIVAGKKKNFYDEMYILDTEQDINEKFDIPKRLI